MQFCSVLRNLYTQVAPPKKGKLLSIPGLIQFVATGGANQNIWQARKRGGKVVRSISLVWLSLDLQRSAKPRFCASKPRFVHRFTQTFWRLSHGLNSVKPTRLRLDPGTFATEDPDEDFYVVALALARACSAENFSISVFHPAYGMLKDQSAGEHSWTEHSRHSD